MTTLHILSGGAAYGLVSRLEAQFKEASGCTLAGTYSAVGVMRDQLLAGAPCDVVILSAALIAQLEASGHVVAGSARDLGKVSTGVAVKVGSPRPLVSSPLQLKSALLAASGIYFPDPIKATAGIHFMNVMKQLGIDAEVASRLRPYPNGATAMAEMAKCPEPGLIGCTQVTEILYTPGVNLIAVLPKEFELATVYTAAVSSKAANSSQAAALVALLSSKDAAALRLAGGFDD
ncbi:MAG: substrate-binding domain-containing protein [Burkholderiaceae bacterium]